MMKDPYDMSSDEFKAALDTMANESDMWRNAHRIYDYLTEMFGVNASDSVLREWAFEWWSGKTNKPYSAIYYKWLEG